MPPNVMNGRYNCRAEYICARANMVVALGLPDKSANHYTRGQILELPPEQVWWFGRILFATEQKLKRTRFPALSARPPRPIFLRRAWASLPPQKQGWYWLLEQTWRAGRRWLTILVPKVLHNSTLSNINNLEKFTVVSVFQRRVSFNNYMDKKR